MLLLGTSRTAGAVDPQEFRRAAEGFGLAPAVLNLARPGSTLEQHRLGLMRIEGRRPRALRGAWVLLEAPAGLPDRSKPSDPWFVDPYPQDLAPLLRLGDVAEVWSSGASFATAWRTTLLWLGRRSVLWNRRRSLRAAFLAQGEAVAAALVDALLPAAPRGPVRPRIDPHARVRQDALHLARARRLMRRITAAQIARPTPAVDWDETSLARLAALCRRLGARLLLFPMPVSTLQRHALSTPPRRHERASLPRALARWGAGMLRFSFPVSDADFPDLWHLRAARRPAYSRALAGAWAARAIRASPPR